MKVLLVFSIGRLDGDVVTMWLTLVDGLTARGAQPYVVMPQRPDARMRSALEQRGVTWKVAPFTWWATGEARPRSLSHRVWRGAARVVSAYGERKIGKLIDEWGIELVYICDGTVTAGLKSAKKRDIPVVWHIHEFMRERLGGLDFMDPEMHVGNTLIKADRIITATKSIRTDLVQRFPGLRGGRMKVIYDGALPEHVFDKPGILDRDVTVFTLAGRIDESGGQEEALRAFIRVAPDFPRAELRIVGVGDDQLESRLKSIAAKSKVAARIVFERGRDDVAELWKETDVALNCSYSESCSMAFCDAMSSGCLMLCSTAEANVELIEGRYGLLYERRKVEALAEKMRWVLTHREMARALAAAGKCRARRLFNLERQLDTVYQTLVEVAR